MGEAENIFSLDKDGLYLVGTSEQSVVPLHMNDVLKKEELPRRYVSYSTCFRREAMAKTPKGFFVCISLIKSRWCHLSQKEKMIKNMNIFCHLRKCFSNFW